jgi:hypothetical protein
MKINTSIHLNRRVRNTRQFCYEGNIRDVLLDSAEFKWGSVTIERVNEVVLCIEVRKVLTACFCAVKKNE